MVAAFLDRSSVDDDELAIEAMREVGPGGHFFGAAHTQARYRTAFHKPMLSDWRNYEIVGGGRLPASAGKGEPHLEGDARGLRAAADGPGPSPRSCGPSSTAASPRAASRRTTERPGAAASSRRVSRPAVHPRSSRVQPSRQPSSGPPDDRPGVRAVA